MKISKVLILLSFLALFFLMNDYVGITENVLNFKLTDLQQIYVLTLAIFLFVLGVKVRVILIKNKEKK